MQVEECGIGNLFNARVKYPDQKSHQGPLRYTGDQLTPFRVRERLQLMLRSKNHHSVLSWRLLQAAAEFTCM